MKKQKFTSADKFLQKLTRELYKLVSGSIPETEISGFITGIRELYKDVDIDIRGICIMAVTEAKVAGRNLAEHLIVFAEEMKALEDIVIAEQK